MKLCLTIQPSASCQEGLKKIKKAWPAALHKHMDDFLEGISEEANSDQRDVVVACKEAKFSDALSKVVGENSSHLLREDRQLLLNEWARSIGEARKNELADMFRSLGNFLMRVVRSNCTKPALHIKLCLKNYLWHCQTTCTKSFCMCGLMPIIKRDRSRLTAPFIKLWLNIHTGTTNRLWRKLICLPSSTTT